MAMPATQRYWTAADLDEFDDEVRREVLHGELFVTPVPALRHARAEWRLQQALTPYCVMHGMIGPLGPGAIRFGPNHLEPDLVVLAPGVSSSAEWDDAPLPTLVVEVNSPSTRRRDSGVKRSAYLSLGVPEYWQLDPRSRTLIVSRPGADDIVTATTYRWQPLPDVVPYVLQIAPLFT
jgi:Uma2 family endonuclease